MGGVITFPRGVYPLYRSFPPRIAAMASPGRSAPACKAASRNSQWLIFGSLSRFWGRGISFLSSQRPPTSAKWPFLDSYVIIIMSAAWRCARGRLKPTRSPPARRWRSRPAATSATTATSARCRAGTPPAGSAPRPRRPAAPPGPSPHLHQVLEGLEKP